MRAWYEKAEESLYDDYERGILTSKELQEALKDLRAEVRVDAVRQLRADYEEAKHGQ